MRKTVRTVVILTASLSATAVTLVPVLLMAILAGLYLNQVFLAVQAPGLPVHFTYKAKGGVYTARAGSYHIDLQGFLAFTARVDRLSIVDANQRQIAKCDFVQLDAFDPVISVRVARPEGIVARTNKGFDIEDAFPIRTEGGPSKAFHVRVTDANLLYEDRTAQPVLRHRIQSKEIVADGLAPDVRVVGTTAISGIGSAPIELDLGKDGEWRLHLKSERLEGRAVWALLRRWLARDVLEPLQGFDAQKLVVRGDLTLGQEFKRPFLVEGRLQAQGEGVRGFDVLRSASVQAAGVFEGQRFSGTVQAREPGLDATAKGAVAWVKGAEFGARVQASAANRARLMAFVQKNIPKAVDFQGARFDGWVGLSGKQYLVRGSAKGTQVCYGAEAVTALGGQIEASPNRVLVRLDQGRWHESPVRGQIQMGDRGRLAGWVKADRVGLERFKVEGLKGNALVTALISGTTAKPQVLVDSQGVVAYDPPGDVKGAVALFEARGRVDGSQVRVDRALVTTRKGVASFRGTADLNSKRLDGDVVAGGFALENYVDNAEGAVYLRGGISGTFENPQFSGLAEVVGGKVVNTSIPIARAAIVANARRLVVDNLRVESGSSNLTGRLALDLKTKRIDGRVAADRVQLAEFAGDAAAGHLSIRDGLISGTLSDPRFRGDLLTERLSVAGWRVASAKAKVIADDQAILVEDLVASMGGGRLLGGARYDLSSQRGSASGTLEAVGLNAYQTKEQVVSLGGQVSGSFSASGSSIDDVSGQSDLAVANLTVDGETIGSGPVRMSLDEGQLIGSFEVGRDDRFLIADRVLADLRVGTVDAEIDVLNLGLEEVIAGVLHRSSVSPEVETELKQLDGKIQSKVTISGPFEAPTIAATGLRVEQLVSGESQLGTLAGEVSYADGLLSIPNLKWLYEQSSLSLEGTIQPSGEIAGSIDLSNFDARLPHTIKADWPRIPAILGLTAQIGGTTDSPTFTGSASATLIDEGKTLKPGEDPPRLDLFSLTLKDKQLDSQGVFSAYGFSGKVSAQGPLEAFDAKKVETSRPIVATVDLQERDLKDLAAFVPWIDPAKTSGQIGGQVVVQAKSDGTKLDGYVALKASSISGQGVSTGAKNVDARLTFDQSSAMFKASGESTRGGSIDAEIRATLANLFASGQSLDEFLQRSTVTGYAKGTGLDFDESITKTEKASGKIEAIDLTVDGSLAQPSIAGDIRIDSLAFDIPTIEGGDKPMPEFLVNPKFNIQITQNNPILMRSTTMRLLLDGSGRVAGTLNYPKVDGLLSVVGGTFSLPTARIDLEEGGTIVAKYDAAPGRAPDARLNVDMVGRTTVTAQKLSPTAERYDITLGIRGSLLEQNGVQLTASSDPPDLRQDEILAILGQKQLIDAIAGQAFGGGRGNIREAVLTAALPALASPLTSGLAGAFGLDYFTIDYNAFEQASFNIGKTLGKGLTLSIRRQLQAVGAQKLKYDVRLTYRLPTRNAILSRTRIGVGFNQDVPWRFTIDYSYRL